MEDTIEATLEKDRCILLSAPLAVRIVRYLSSPGTGDRCIAQIVTLLRDGSSNRNGITFVASGFEKFDAVDWMPTAARDNRARLTRECCPCVLGFRMPRTS